MAELCVNTGPSADFGLRNADWKNGGGLPAQPLIEAASTC